MSSAMTRDGICCAYSTAASARPRSTKRSMSDRQSARVPASCFSTARGANAGSRSRRDQPCSGGSESIGGACTCSVPGTTDAGDDGDLGGREVLDVVGDGVDVAVLGREP